MSHVAYPVDNDILQRADALGLLAGLSDATKQILVDGKADVVSTEWERKVGWDPFLSSGTSDVRYFDPPGSKHRYPASVGMWTGGNRILLHGSGILTLTEVLVNVSPTNTGDVRTENTDFYQVPYNETPKRGLDFGWPIIGSRRSLSIEAIWGYSTTVPNDVWEGLVMYGVYQVASQFLLQFLNQPVEWSEGDVRERVDSGLITQYADTSTSPGITAFRRLVLRYMNTRS